MGAPDDQSVDDPEIKQLETAIAAEADDYDDTFTPVQDVIAIARTKSERDLAIAFWKKSGNQELRFRKSRNRSAEAAMRRDIDRHDRAIVDIRGEHGNNGKLGEQKRRLDSLFNRGWGLVIALIGGIGAIATKLVLIGQAYGALLNQVETNKQQIQVLQADNQMLRAVMPVPRKDPTP